jgi:uncharacterized protein (DUF1778 family)
MTPEPSEAPDTDCPRKKRRRSSKDRNRTRPRRINVRLSDVELYLISKGAKGTRLSRATFMRKASLKLALWVREEQRAMVARDASAEAGSEPQPVANEPAKNGAVPP